MYAIKECSRGAQKGVFSISLLLSNLEVKLTKILGGVSVVVYFRKEGRALREVTRYVLSIGKDTSFSFLTNQNL